MTKAAANTTITAFPGARNFAAPTGYEETLAACRAEMEAAGLSHKQVAREIGRGVSDGTLSKWLRGIYGGRHDGDLERVTARIATWLETRAEAARRDMAAAGLDRHVELGVTEDIESALAHAQATGDVVLIHGRSGCGKSWAVARYCGRHSAAYRLAVTDAVTSLAGLLDRVAQAVGAGADYPSALAAETAIITNLQGRGALLCVDEAHHLSPRLLDELRCIRDLAGCGLALVGEDGLFNLLAKSPRCQQIVGRVGIRLPLAGAAEADLSDLARAVLGRAPNKGERKTIAKAAAGAGGLHALRRLFGRAWVLARAAGRDRITADDLAAAAEEGAPC